MGWAFFNDSHRYQNGIAAQSGARRVYQPQSEGNISDFSVIIIYQAQEVWIYLNNKARCIQQTHQAYI